VSLNSARAAETLVGVLALMPASSATLQGIAIDTSNRAADGSWQYVVCYDSPTENCESPRLANEGKNRFSYPIPAGRVGTVTPRDGNEHMMYLRVVSHANPGAGDVPFQGSPWPLKWNARMNRLGPMWTPKVSQKPGRLSAAQMAVIARTGDPFSVGIAGNVVCNVAGTLLRDDGAAGYFIKRHNVPCENARAVTLTTVQEFGGGLAGFMTQANCKDQLLKVTNALPPNIQAITLAWVSPGQVQGGDGPWSISGVVGYGGFPKGTHLPSGLGQGPINAYFNSATSEPFTDHAIRPTMLLAGEACSGCTANNNYSGPVTWRASFPAIKSVIDAAVDSAGSNPSGNVYWAWTADTARNAPAQVTSQDSIGSGVLGAGITSTVLGSATSPVPPVVSGRSILAYSEPSPHWSYNGATFVRGAGIGIGVTSSSGTLPQDQSNNQTAAASWLAQGAVAAYGAGVEPGILLLYKMPDIPLFIGYYRQGQTLIEALWKSVRLPWQGQFIGDPLAAPYSLPGEKR